MSNSRVFKSTKSQVGGKPNAVKLPDHGKSVEDLNQENGRIDLPAGDSWDAFFNDAPLGIDFMSDRNQPPLKPR